MVINQLHIIDVIQAVNTVDWLVLQKARDCRSTPDECTPDESQIGWGRVSGRSTRGSPKTGVCINANIRGFK